jgi:hypothetical protein
MGDTLPDEAHAPTQAWIGEWQRRSDDALTYRRAGEAIFVDDARGDAPQHTHAFHGPLARAYEACCDTMRTPRQVAAQLGAGYDESGLRAALDGFCDAGLMVAEADRYLSLALPANPNW